VHLSPSAVRRRLQDLRDAGVIVANVAIVDPATLGDTYIVQVTFAREDPAAVASFRERMAQDSAVSQCYAVSGDIDYWLVVHAESAAAYHSWGERVLMADPAIRRYTTSVVWSRPVFRHAIAPAAG
jgi:DNA-binding Lrp family transcriptional regulator